MTYLAGLLRWASLRNQLVWVVDLGLTVCAFYVSYAIAHGSIPVPYVPGFLEKIGAFTLVTALSFAAFGVAHGSWRYVSIPELLAIVKASAIAVLCYTVGAFLVSRADNVPRLVPLLTFLFMVGGMSGMRLAYRLSMDGMGVDLFRRGERRGRGRPSLVIGLTDEAESFIRGALRSPNSPISVVGVVDQRRAKVSRSVQGVPVFSGVHDLKAFLNALTQRGIQLEELIVAERRPSRQRLGEIIEAANAVGLRVTRIPDVTDTASITRHSLLETKPIELGDLLGRPEVRIDLQGVARLVSGRTVLATGAGGSIGSELCRQIATFEPKLLVITDGSEFHLYNLDKELRERHPGLPIATRLLDVREPSRVKAVFREFQPEVVFHAAALKHVPLVEENPIEGIKTNVLGTRNVADAALNAGSAAFIMISTDKAVNPTNVMGATKRAAEAYCQALDVSSTRTRFKTVRFGNVLGSNGSVVPRFQEQIAAGGPVTVTHPNIVRFFMTIPEAVRLVLQASSHALQRQSERGKIMVLDMGKPVRIVDLAERMIQLAGYRPRLDIDIVFTGLRPGEKLYEELFDPAELQDDKTQDGYVIAAPRVIDQALLHRTLSGLEGAVGREDRMRAIELLSHIVPEYKPAAGQIAASESGGDSAGEAGS